MDLIDEILAGMTLTSVDDLNDDVLGLLLWEAREYGPALALTCRRWARLVKKTAPASLETLARKGHASLLAWIPKTWPYLAEEIDWASLMEASAVGGHWGLCFSIMRQEKLPPDCAVLGAASGGHVGMLPQLFELVKASPSITGILDDMLINGATGGHAAVCQLAIDRGASMFYGMTLAALRGGREAICVEFKLLTVRQLGMTKGALTQAAVEHDAVYGAPRMCSLLREWEWLEPGQMMAAAAAHGSEQLCRLARDWGSTATEDMLVAATAAGSESLCRLAHEWGVRGTEIYEDMLIEAASLGFKSICRLALQWGARDLDSMFMAAADCGKLAICQMAVEEGSRDSTDFPVWLEENLCAALESAIREGDVAMCRQMLDWGADPDFLLELTGAYLNVDLLWLALERGANPKVLGGYLPEEVIDKLLAIPRGAYDEVLYLGAEMIESGEGLGIQICEQALQGSTRYVKWLLCRAAYISEIELCRLAVKHGARDFNSMLLGATAGESTPLIALARKWGATIAPPPAGVLRQVRSE